MGQSGTGKPHVIAATGSALVNVVRRVLFIRTTDLAEGRSNMSRSDLEAVGPSASRRNAIARPPRPNRPTWIGHAPDH